MLYSNIVHKKYETTRRPYERFDLSKIRNYKDKKIGVREYNDFYSEDEDIYLVEYDEVKNTKEKEIAIIDEVINENANFIDFFIKLTDSENDELYQRMKACLTFRKKGKPIEVDKIVNVLNFLNIKTPEYIVNAKIKTLKK